MQITGGCHCGHVRYQAEIDPQAISVCHCKDCQTLTGSPFRVTVSVPAEAISQTGNPAKCYRKIAESNRVRLHYFCPECGTPLFATGEGDHAARWGIRWGSIDQRQSLAPSRQIWCRSAVDWLDDIASLPGQETQ